MKYHLRPLRKVRMLKGLNQYDIACRTGITQSRLSLIENDYYEPKPEERQKLAEALGVSVEEIFPEGRNKNENTKKVQENF